MKKRIAVILVGLLISTAALILFLYQIKDPAKLWESFLDADYGLVLLAAAMNFGFFFFIRTSRWQLFLRPIKHIPYWSVFRATCIGFLANNLLPLRVGEIIRPFIIHRKADVPFGKAVGSSFGLERPFDMVGLVVLMLVTWPFLPSGRPAEPPVPTTPKAAVVQEKDAQPTPAPAAKGRKIEMDDIRKAGWVLVAATTVGVIMLLLVGIFPEFFIGIVRRFLFFLPEALRAKLVDFARSLAEPMQFMKRPGPLALAFVQSTALWVGVGCSQYVLSRAFGIRIPLIGGFFCAIVIALAVSLPGAPSFIGQFQLGAAAAIGLFGADPDKGAAFAITIWIISILPVTLVGLGCLWYEGLSLRGLAREANAEVQDEQEEDA